MPLVEVQALLQGLMLAYLLHLELQRCVYRVQHKIRIEINYYQDHDGRLENVEMMLGNFHHLFEAE